MGWIGGGDAKLAAVVALWLGADLVLPYVLYTAVFGGLLTLAILQFRTMALPSRCITVGWINRLHASTSGVPYGVAIASAALVVFLQSPWIEAFT
jgi:prepilin peptidase CpaA